MSVSPIDYLQMNKDAVELLQDFIINKCINDGTPASGQEIRSVNRLIKYFESYDITAYEIFEPEEGRANLLIKYNGKASSDSLMYENHLDVVPANPDDWEVDPYSGIIKDDCLWGRGALDMLIFSATQAAAFAHTISSGWKPKGDFYYLAVADEEAGGEYGAKWLVEKVPEKIKADYLIGEFGGAMIETPSGPKAGLMIAEKGPAWSVVKAKGTPGHASMPYNSDNAIITMKKILSKIDKNSPKVVITEPWKQFVKGLDRGKLANFLLTHKFTLNKLLPRIAKKDEAMAKAIYSLTRMTITPTIINGGTKANVIPDRASVEFDVRLLPGQDWNYVENYFKTTLGELWDEIELEKKLYFPGSSDDWNTPLISSIRSTYNRIVPNSEITPMFLPAVTDSRFFRDIGIKCYGFCILTNKVSQLDLSSMAHGINERVPMEAIEKSTRFFADLAQNFLG
ncbi:MAG: M20/M25/M40 family metallo-hydrolase [Candidatus Kariarchaeaceae archaeon]